MQKVKEIGTFQSKTGKELHKHVLVTPISGVSIVVLSDHTLDKIEETDLLLLTKKEEFTDRDWLPEMIRNWGNNIVFWSN